jgi:hypothetical protein
VVFDFDSDYGMVFLQFGYEILTPLGLVSNPIDYVPLFQNVSKILIESVIESNRREIEKWIVQLHVYWNNPITWPERGKLWVISIDYLKTSWLYTNTQRHYLAI